MMEWHVAACERFDEDQTVEMKEKVEPVAHFSCTTWHHLSRPILEKKTDDLDLNRKILL